MVGSGESFGRSVVGTRSGELSRGGAELVSLEDADDGTTAFYFDGPLEPPIHPNVSLTQQKIFKADFYRELTNVKRWSAEAAWPKAIPATLQIFVSANYKISKSLVPAWYGRAGHMEFPAWRVIARKAAIAHELAHVFFPNGNRFLAEGLAVYLQAEIGGNPAFPNFGKPLHQLVGALLQEMVPDFSARSLQTLSCIHLSALDEIATPNPLTLKVGQDFYGEEPGGQARIYPVAGSFVQFLIETRGLEKFRALYLKTPLLALRQSAGAPHRWASVYGVSLTELEEDWKSMVSSMTGELLQQDQHREYGNA
jgi:hypothetical protein